MWNLLGSKLQRKPTLKETKRRAEWDKKNLKWLEDFHKEQKDKEQMRLR